MHKPPMRVWRGDPAFSLPPSRETLPHKIRLGRQDCHKPEWAVSGGLERTVCEGWRTSLALSSDQPKGGASMAVRHPARLAGLVAAVVCFGTLASAQVPGAPVLQNAFSNRG